jgi:hypothetical protein
MDGAAAAQRDREKTYGQLEPNGYPFIQFSAETYDHLRKPAISFLGQLGGGGGTKVSKSGFVAAAIRLAWGCAGVTIRCMEHRWACLQGCPDVGSVRELLTSRRRCGNRYQCTDLCCVLWTGSSGLRDVWSL